MNRSDVVRLGTRASLIGGGASVLEFALYPVNEMLAELLLVVAYVLTAVGLAGLHALQGGSTGRLGLVGLVTASIGSMLAAAAMTVALVADRDLDLLHSVGAFLLIGGYMLYGVATLRAQVLPAWCGIAMTVVGPLMFVLVGFGGYTTLIFGLFWFVLGYVLWSRQAVVHRRLSPIG